jgi:HEAT repeat protein
MTAIALLEHEVARFRAWDDALSNEGRSAEWETYYENWGALYQACREYLNTPLNTWSDEGIQLLLYAIARDNEGEIIIDELTQEQLVTLSAAALESAEMDAKWQLAMALGRYPLCAENDALLSRFVQDPHEYVRRRALLALAESLLAHTPNDRLTTSR